MVLNMNKNKIIIVTNIKISLHLIITVMFALAVRISPPALFLETQVYTVVCG